nr:hypothetical protein [Planosporangium flavigriseum]
MSREEVVELVNKIVDPDPAVKSSFDANHLGKLESGKIGCPRPALRAALRAVLKADSDADLGFAPPAACAVTVDDMNRREMLSTSIGTLAGTALAVYPVIELLAATDPQNAPASVGRDHIDHVLSVADLLEHCDNTRGGAVAARTIADQQLREAARLLTVPCSPDLRADLYTALAHLAGVVGFMLFDAYAHDDARNRFTFALQCADIANNWHQRAMLLSSMARQAVWCGQPDDGLTWTEMGLVRADRLTATERAMLHTVRARALAKLGPARAQDVLAAVGAADEAFAKSDPGEDPPWMRFYDVAQHHGDTAHALFDVAMRTGLTTEAADRFAYSVLHHAPEYARSRAISRTKLATLTMIKDDPRKAACIGHEALDDAGPVQSLRARDDLRALYRASGRHATIEDVRDLRTRVAATVGVGT